ncbi:MAG: 3-deoxy-D-manno-octulosonic acid kinase [Gammaproteobacteria bacterium]|nr:3-deoxy-D-manno-octulosonic acid kinase [Gammaproteobacteria bacterium]
MSRKIARYGGEVILYDDALLSHAGPALFAPALQAARATGGRGATLFIECAGQPCVLRHYYRGGLIGRLLSDQFLWLGESITRCFREWLLLEQLFDMGLPVPRPVAARYQRAGFIYRADLLTARLPDVESLAVRLGRGAVSTEVWGRIGECIARFHAAGVWHADLNAHNIQLDAADRIFLLDFDRGRIRPVARGWQQSNLARLQRSLRKISASSPGAPGFSAAEWRWLVEGHEAALAAAQR